MAPILPSAQANKGDEYLRKARDLRDQWGQLISGDDLTAVQNRITMSALFVSTLHAILFTFFTPRATDLRHGLDGKYGVSKIVHARTYRKYAQETLRVIQVLFLYLHVLPGLIGSYRRLLIEPGMQSISHLPTTRTMSKSGAPSGRQRGSTGPFSATRTRFQPLSRSLAGKKPSGRWHVMRLGPTSPRPLTFPKWCAMFRLLLVYFSSNQNSSRT